MATNYTILGQYPTIETLGGTQTRDVQAIQAQTKPSGIYYETRIPSSGATTANIRSDVNGYAIIYELLLTIPGVVSVQWAQEPNAAGLLEDHVLIYYESTSGQSSGVFDMPYSKWTQNYAAAHVKTGIAALDAVEAS